MRISNQSQVLQTKRNMSSLQGRIAEHQTNIATGKRVRVMSDDPSAAAQAYKFNRQLRHLDQYSRNLSDAKSWLDLADQVSQTVDDRLTRARDLMLQSDSGVLGQNARSAIAQELRGIAEEVADSLNTTRAGHPIFGGTSSSDTPFDANGVFSGNTKSVLRSVSDTVQLEVNIDGDLIAGAYDAATPADGNIMQVLNAVATDIDNGLAANTHLTRMDELQQGVHSAQATIGARQRAVEGHEERIGDTRLSVEISRSDAIDVDITRELLDLKATEVSYQASIGVAARVLSASVLDFLR